MCIRAFVCVHMYVCVFARRFVYVGCGMRASLVYLEIDKKKVQNFLISGDNDGQKKKVNPKCRRTFLSPVMMMASFLKKVESTRTFFFLISGDDDGQFSK